MRRSKYANVANTTAPEKGISNPTAEEVACRGIYSIHNYLVLPNTILSEIPEKYKKAVEDYLFDKMLKLFKLANKDVDAGMQILSKKVALKLERLHKDYQKCIQEVTLILKDKISKEITQSITVKELQKQIFEIFGKHICEYWMGIFPEILENHFEYQMERLSSSQEGKEELNKAWQEQKEKLNKEINCFLNYQNIACDIISEIGKDTEIFRTLLISSFTNHVKSDEQLDFTGELILDIPEEEFQFLMDKAQASNQHGLPYITKMYVAFKKQSCKGNLKAFFSKEEEALKNVRAKLGEREADRLYGD